VAGGRVRQGTSVISVNKTQTSLQLVIYIESPKTSAPEPICEMYDQCTACFTVTSLTQIPMQVSKWLAVCETSKNVAFKCMVTDVQVLAANKALRVLMVYDGRDPLVMQVPGWAEPYTARRDHEAVARAPLPGWVTNELDRAGAYAGPPTSHLASAKHLAEVLLALFTKCRQIDITDRTSLATCFDAQMTKLVNRVEGLRPLTDGQVESILELADQWRGAFAEQAKLDKERQRMEEHLRQHVENHLLALNGAPWAGKAHARSATACTAGEFPALGPSPSASPLSPSGRSAYLHSNEPPPPSAIRAYDTAWSSQSLSSLGFEPDSPFVPKINPADLARLGRVAYLGPGKAQRVWYPCSYALYAPKYTASLVF
jgi:hypothetical protein